MDAEFHKEYKIVQITEELTLAVDKRNIYAFINRGGLKIKEHVNYGKKIYKINGKETAFWMLGNGLRVSAAPILAKAWLGPRPSGYGLSFKDGNRLNYAVDNLEYKIKKHHDGNIVGITYDKEKDRWRVQLKGLKRSCHKTKEEAIAAAKQQGGLKEEKDDEEHIIEETDSEEESDMTPEEKKIHDHFDKQYEANLKKRGIVE